ncbi:MAG: tRNA dihydrouridine synthase DusB [Candidatus Omnitrophica bacterium]|nr:tRNA dihydrouridine synthase DusB [Candidatus Omnitrophota bacterium]MDD5429484.1 tRNA dihydrouridine synthase DusB [Candidatus Omnitrophota bacterium]
MIRSTKPGFLLPLIILAPLSGISSLPFRVLNREFGCRFAFSEMISARSLSYSSRRTMEMLKSNAYDRPLGIQLLGADTYYILKALDRLKDLKFDVLDFNAACPRKKVTSHGKGAALLREAGKLKEILKTLVKECWVPVTLKMRLGWDSREYCLDIAKAAQDAGVNAVFVHGRTCVQGYRGEVDYSAIRKIKRNLNIPVIGSGDILSPEAAKKMLDKTGCDGVVVARGALGNPWIFREIEEFLSKGKMISRPSPEEVARAMKRQLDLTIDFYGERNALIKFRKFYIWYTRGFTKTKPLRINAAKARSKLDMLELIEEFVSIRRND